MALYAKIFIVAFLFLIVGCSSMSSNLNLDMKQHNRIGALKELNLDELYVLIAIEDGKSITVKSTHDSTPKFNTDEVYSRNLYQLKEYGENAYLEDCIIIRKNGDHDLCHRTNHEGSIFSSKKIDAAEALTHIIFSPLSVAFAVLELDTKHIETPVKNSFDNVIDEDQIIQVGNYLNMKLDRSIISEWNKKKLQEKERKLAKIRVLEQAAKEKAAKEKAIKEKAIKEKAIKEKIAKEKAAKERTIYGEIVGSKNLKDAKFINGLIWQDQVINARSREVNDPGAEEYCKDLTLLGVRGWMLPSKEDFERLGSAVTQLQYRNKSGAIFTYSYPTRNVGLDCPDSRRRGDCRYKANIVEGRTTPNIFKTNNSYENGPIRCVLSVDKYNNRKKAEASSHVKKQTFRGYLEAFNSTGEKEYIDKANKLAKTIREKTEIEFALIKYFGLDNIFTMSGEILGDSDGSSRSDDTFIVRMRTSRSDAVSEIDVKVKDDSKLKPKYGRYEIKIRVRLHLKYTNVAFGIGTTKTEVVEKDDWIVLAPQNNWSGSLRTEFNDILQRLDSVILRRLDDVRPEITFEEIELL